MPSDETIRKVMAAVTIMIITFSAKFIIIFSHGHTLSVLCTLLIEDKWL